MVRVDTIYKNLPGGTGGICMDANNNLYSGDFAERLMQVDSVGDKLFKLDSRGELSVFATGLRGASGNAIDQQGNLYQSNVRSDFISVINQQGQHTPFAQGPFKIPVGIAVAANQYLYVADCGAACVWQVSPKGEAEVYVADELLFSANGICFDDDGNIYVANFFNGDVIKINPDKKVSRFATIAGNNNGHIAFQAPYLYVVARSAHQIYRISLDGQVDLLAGSGSKGCDDGAAKQASFCFPNGLAFSHDKRYLYVNQIGNTETDGEQLSPTSLRRIDMGCV